MNKAELVKAMVNQAEQRNGVKLSARQMGAVLSSMIGTVTDALKNGEKVVLPGFGMFAVKTRPARQGRNPLTGEVMAILERKMPAFKAGKALKDAVAGE